MDNSQDQQTENSRLAAEVDPSSEEHRPDYSFPRSARLLRQLDFQRVHAEGRTVHLPPLVFRVRRRKAGEDDSIADLRVHDLSVQDPKKQSSSALQARLGLAISRKVGGAVIRNHLKRRLREGFRHRRAELEGWDLVVSARSGAEGLSSDEVNKRLDQVVQVLRKQGQTGSPRRER